MDIHYENQKIYCKNRNVPMFANSACSHDYPWVRDELYGNRKSFGEMLVDKYGEEQSIIISSSEHIISCPSCCRSWCD